MMSRSDMISGDLSWGWLRRMNVPSCLSYLLGVFLFTFWSTSSFFIQCAINSLIPPPPDKRPVYCVDYKSFMANRLFYLRRRSSWTALEGAWAIRNSWTALSPLNVTYYNWTDKNCVPIIFGEYVHNCAWNIPQRVRSRRGSSRTFITRRVQCSVFL